MKFLTTIPTNRKSELVEMFNNFNADYSDENETYILKGSGIFSVVEGVKSKYPTWGFVSCKCKHIEILPCDTDREYCINCGDKW